MVTVGMAYVNTPAVRALPFLNAALPRPLAFTHSIFRTLQCSLHGGIKASFQLNRLPISPTHVCGGGGTGGGRSVMTHARRGFLTELRKLKQEQDFAADLEYQSPLEIIEYPDPRLRAKNKHINKFDKKLQQLVDEMFDLMYKTDGVGLSAPQVGVNVQLMVFNPAGERGKGEEIVLVNPEIYKYSKKKEVFQEGCLSFPEIYADVERPSTVKIEARDIAGKKFILSLKEFHARIFQHEYDHLQGILFFERMRPDILDTIRPELQALEQKYEIKMGVPPPESVRDCIREDDCYLSTMGGGVR